MKLLFSAPNSLLSRAIRFLTWSRWSHVDVVFGDRVFGAVAPHGVGWTPLAARIAGSRRVELVEVHLSGALERGIADWLLAQDGKRYDWTAMLGFLCRRDWQDPARWFCSELIAAAFDRAGRPLIRRAAWRVTPQDLYQAILQGPCSHTVTDVA